MSGQKTVTCVEGMAAYQERPPQGDHCGRCILVTTKRSQSLIDETDHCFKAMKFYSTDTV